MRTITRTVYTLSELKEQHPKAYAKVWDRWREVCCSYAIPWADEMVDSWRAVCEACDCELTDYDVVPYGMVTARVTPNDDENVMDKAAFVAMLQRLGYWKDDAPHFPGLCAFTGYCGDDDILEDVARAVLDKGESIPDALESAAYVVRKHLEDAQEQHEDEESMQANWGHLEFYKDGTLS